MNKILHLFDKNYVIDLFKKELLPLYPQFTDIENIDIYAYKKNIWEKTYHVVIAFDTKLINPKGENITLPIICSAHSDEPRKNVFDALQFLWQHGFAKGNLSIPHALFYSDYLRGTFYRGVDGTNLYQYIRVNDKKTIEDILPKTAQWFAKLHQTPTKEARNFNKENSRIRTVFPGVEHILYRIEQDYPEYAEAYEKIYKQIITAEEKFLNSNKQRWLVHGDAHPENIIRMSDKKIGVIDFTDLCLSDFARDLGTFMQQLEYMTTRKISAEYGQELKEKFLNEYLKANQIELSENLKERINIYYNWTTMRTATHFLLKDNSEPERSKPLIEKIKNNLNIK